MHLRSLMLRRVLPLSLLVIACTGASYAQYYVVSTRDLKLVYLDESQRYIIPHTVRSFENSLAFHKRLFSYAPTEEVLILLQDFSDYGYAGATTIPYNFMTVGIESFEYVFETSPTNERMNWVMSHELMHVVASDKATSGDAFFRGLLGGKVLPTSDNPLSMLYTYLTNPRRYAPRWYHEGIAVYMETWMSGGIGRVLGGYDEMSFRTMTLEGSSFYDFVGLESEGTSADFQIGQNAYLYGTRFMSYLSSQYGPEKLLQWVNRTEDSRRDYAGQFREVYGTTLDEEWTRWTRWEDTWQKENLQTIGSTPVTPFRMITKSPVGSVSRSHYDPAKGVVYAAVNYPAEFAHIEEISVSTGTRRTICDVPTPALYYVTSLAYDPDSSRLFFTTQNSWLWRDVNVVDIRTGKSKQLLKDIRTGDLAFCKGDRSLWGVQHNNGFTSLVRIPEPHSTWYPVLTLPYGKDIYDIDISPDGRWLIGSLIEVSGRVSLVRMNADSLRIADAHVEELYEFEVNAPANFVFSPDGSSLLGTSYFTGVSNVYRYDFAAKKMDILTNAETGFFRPVPMSSDSAIAWRYTAGGFMPIAFASSPREDVNPIKYLGQETVERHPVVTTWKLGSPLSVNADSVIISRGLYNPLKELTVASFYPVAEGFKDVVAAGLRLNVADPLGLNRGEVILSYSPHKIIGSGERLHASARFRTLSWTFAATANKADFYDLFGPTKVSRKGYSVSALYKGVFFSDPPESMDWAAGAAGFWGLERLPDYQNIQVQSTFDQFAIGHARTNYKKTRKTLGGIEPEQGILGEAQVQATTVRGRLYPRLWTSIDYGIILPIKHSSLWLRGSAGLSRGGRQDPFAQFYFGGFGNNWVDYQDAKRYRTVESFPGAELNAIGGTTFGKLIVEWTMPPVRFRRFGIPNFYCTWSHAALFVSGVGANIDNSGSREMFGNIGAQADFKVVILSRLDVTISVGYAIAAGESQRRTDELMVSLKIL